MDPVALRILCIVRAFLEDQEVAEAMPSSQKSDTHGALISFTLSIIAREGVLQPYVFPDIKMSEHAIRELCRLYIGQQRTENDADYLQRLNAARLLNPSDLRLARHVCDFSSPERAQHIWVFPFTMSDCIKQTTDIIEEEISLHEARCNHNKTIKEERPTYSNNDTFIQWVTKNHKLVSSYLKNSNNEKTNFDKKFPGFQKVAKSIFFKELDKKADHEKAFLELKERMPKVLDNSGKRLWQLVQQTADLIDTIYSNSRSEENYNIIVHDESEAHFVMKLIYEWSRNAWKGSIDKNFAEAFHGPEVHIWGEGPRIPHFNAGVYLNETLVNVHIFFYEGQDLINS